MVSHSIELPTAFRDPRLRFIKLGDEGRWLKTPIEIGWNIFDLKELEDYIAKRTSAWDADEASGKHAELSAKGKRVPKKPEFRGRLNNYSFDDPKFVTWLKYDQNYGVTAAGGLIKLESDDVARWDKLGVLSLLDETFTVKSSTENRRHYYFFGPEVADCPLNDPETGEDIGHIRGTGDEGGRGGMVVGPGSKHPSGTRYKVIKDLPIATISSEVLEKIKSILCKPTVKKTKKHAAGKDAKDTKKSRSTRKGYSQKSIDISANIKIGDIALPLDIVSDDGIEIQGSHPIHGSTSGKNFSINPTMNIWHCFRCESGGGPLEWLAVKAYLRQGISLAPGMEIGYIVKDADRWEVETERDAAGFDAGYYEKLLEMTWREVAYAVIWYAEGFN